MIDNLNTNFIPENAFLIRFDVVNMFPSILVIIKFLVIMHENLTAQF